MVYCKHCHAKLLTLTFYGCIKCVWNKSFTLYRISKYLCESVYGWQKLFWLGCIKILSYRKKIIKYSSVSCSSIAKQYITFPKIEFRINKSCPELFDRRNKAYPKNWYTFFSLYSTNNNCEEQFSSFYICHWIRFHQPWNLVNKNWRSLLKLLLRRTVVCFAAVYDSC